MSIVRLSNCRKLSVCGLHTWTLYLFEAFFLYLISLHLFYWGKLSPKHQNSWTELWLSLQIPNASWNHAIYDALHATPTLLSKRFKYLQISHNFIICKRLLSNSTHIWQNSFWQLLISHMISYHRARLSLTLRYTYNNRTDFLWKFSFIIWSWFFTWFS